MEKFIVAKMTFHNKRILRIVRDVMYYAIQTIILLYVTMIYGLGRMNMLAVTYTNFSHHTGISWELAF
ncbi:hypothetical protein NQ317_015332 [Molorchus minor]|uniref:ABC transporter permease n=1 Tax=Molorchus minor TaxID=1323400 RepID=A0ABQ9J690_9CUCU|nr:hypothetical protein NQ317_015332 [Molorchus minor]